MAKKTTTQKPAKKVAAKKAAKKATKKVAAKKAPVKKASSKAAPAKKQPAATQAPGKKFNKTSIIARVDVGFGNSLYIRGQGAGLSWDKGVQLDNVSPYEWTFANTSAKGDVNFKFLINDEVWAEGDNLVVAAGGTSISSPVFVW